MEAGVYNPKYKVVSEHLRTEILNGQYKVGKPLPSQNKLVKKYKVSLTTIRQSLGELIQEGWIKAEHGRGFFVTKTPDGLPETTSNTNSSTSAAFVWWYDDTCTEASSQVYLSIMNGAATEFKKHGIEIIYARFDPRSDSDNKDLAKFIRRQNRVIISGMVDLELLDKIAVGNPRVVVAGEAVKDIEQNRFSVIDSDSENAGCLSVQYLLAHNHRNLALVIESGTSHFEKIKKGFQNACREHELPEPHVFEFHDVFDGADPNEKVINKRINAAAEKIVQDSDITGIVVTGNVYCERLILRLVKLGCNIPKNKSFISISGTPREEMIINNMTQIKMPCDLVGIEAAKLLLRTTDGETIVHKSLPPRLLAGGSVTLWETGK